MSSEVISPDTNSIDISDLRVDGERLWQSLMDLAQIGATPKAESAA
jgi:N-carbamoyl-L-amino-acid hydrolase